MEEELRDKIIIRKEGNNKFIILETQKEKNALVLGNNDLETVQIYIHMDQKDIISQYNKYNPGDKLLAS